MNAIEEIKNRVDIVDLISEDVKLRKSGKNYTGFCPFHANTRTPAFVVFPDTATWRCFGECNEGGDIFRYVMKKEGWDFKEALRALAERAGVRLEPLTPQRKEEMERSDQLRRLLDDAVIFYRSQILQTEAGQKAMAYLVEKRGIREDTAEVWGLGYAPASWDAALNYFTAKGYPQQDLIDSGLVTEREGGGVYDRFRHRLMFPIRDAGGRMTGFGGRVLNPDDIPKFINSPQTILFDKSSLLYGLDQARKAIRKEDQAVIVEGYLDVIVLHQEGFRNAVSPMGTALTEAQMRQLKRFTRRIVMALDPDAAGVKATLRGLEVARETLDRTAEMVFDARGLLHTEARLQADLRVSALPDGLDPDEIVLRDPQEWQGLIETAKPIIHHVLDTLMEGQVLDDPKVKSSIASRILPLIADVPNPVERDAYRQQTARALQVNEESLLMLSNQRVRTGRRTSRQTVSELEKGKNEHQETSAQAKIRAVEQHVLSFLTRGPELVYKINRYLQEQGLDRLAAEDMFFSEHQQVLSVILDSLSQDKEDPDIYVREEMGEDMENYAILPMEIKNREENNQRPMYVRELEEAIRLIMHLRRVAVDEQISQLRFLQESGANDNDEEVGKEIPSRLFNLVKQRGLLDRALAKPVVMD